MKSTIWFAVAAWLLLAAGNAGAQGGINLSWDDRGTHGFSARTFARDTNAGSSVLIPSWQPPAIPYEHCFPGISAILDVQTAGAALPDWWRYRTAGSCRQNSLRPSTDLANPIPSCPEPWFCPGTPGLFLYEPGHGGPNRLRTGVSVSIGRLLCHSVIPDVEVTGSKIVIDHARSTGAGACMGCEEGACIVLNSVELALVTRSGQQRVPLTAPLSGNFVVWPSGVGDCPAATPVGNTTWGRLKSSYR